MPQTAAQITGIADKAAADAFVVEAEKVAGVKMVNVNHDDGKVVITHDASMNLDDVKKVASGMGYTLS